MTHTPPATTPASPGAASPAAAHGHGPRPARPHGADHGADHRADGQAELLDLDAEVLAEHTAAITAWLPVGPAPRRILDLGCGTGAGTFALLRRFPGAEVTAVDASDAHLHRLLEKAEAAGAAGRVHALRADLDADWPDLGTPDLVWASASVHHLADPDLALRRVRALLPPGGLFAVVEPAGFPRFLPPDAPEDRPGLEERCHAALARRHAAQVPHRGADWGPRLTAAGFTVEAERTVTAAVGASRGDAVARYALASLRRIREGAAGALADADLAALDALLDPEGPHGIARRGDLAVRTERTVWAARRP